MMAAPLRVAPSTGIKQSAYQSTVAATKVVTVLSTSACVSAPSGIKRVAILDFDVHHGNGTQACVANVVPATRKVRLHSILPNTF